MSDKKEKDDRKDIPKAIHGLELLRSPFPEHQISKLPKPTKQQTEDVKNDYKKGIKCKLCGSWHHPDVVHLDYVGHAALTDRLLDCDEKWSWEPLALKDGLPAFDSTGGLWIKLTVCGVTRLGYGHAASATFKEIGSREKEVIGDALRNAGMRFGAALDLWHKGDLHLTDQDEAPAEKPAAQKGSTSMKTREPAIKPKNHAPGAVTEPQRKKIFAMLKEVKWTEDELKSYIGNRWGIASTKDLTSHQAGSLIERLSNGKSFKTDPGV